MATASAQKPRIAASFAATPTQAAGLVIPAAATGDPNLDVSYGRSANPVKDAYGAAPLRLPGGASVTSLSGRRVLVVDDEPLIALMVADMLAELGAIAVGPLYSHKQALQALAAGGFECVILDVNLGDSLSFPFARELKALGIPFCFTTGYGAAVIPDEFSDTLVLPKPYETYTLAQCLEPLFCASVPLARSPETACAKP
jgi:CheY-like chemotaxis protein